MDHVAPLLPDPAAVPAPSRGPERDEILRLVARLRASAVAPDIAARYLPDAKQALRLLPDHPLPQICVAELIGRAAPGKDMLDTWSGIHRRFPDDAAAFFHRIDGLFTAGRNDVAYGVMQAALIRAGRAGPAMTREFIRLTRARPDDRRLPVLLAHWHLARGNPAAAAAVYQCHGAIFQAEDPQFAARLDNGLAAYHRIAPDTYPTAPRIIAAAVRCFATRHPRRTAPENLDGIVIACDQITESAAARDRLRLAGTLQRHQAHRRRAQGITLTGGVRVLATAKSPMSDQDILSREIELGAVPIDTLTRIQETTPPLTGRHPADGTGLAADGPDDLKALLDLLPTQMTRDLELLAGYLRDHAPDVICLTDWTSTPIQVLAALLAEVPKIQIVADRPIAEHTPDLAPILQELVMVPGAGLTCRRTCDRTALADAAHCPPEMISVVPAAIFPANIATDPTQQDRWRMFDATTDPGCLTIGLLVERHSCAAPMPGLSLLADILDIYPDTRFLVLGSAGACRRMRGAVTRAGLLHKVFFAGTLSMRAFWIDKLDLCVPMSADPAQSTLIETLIAGVPMLGGGPAVADVLTDGRCGYVAQTPDEIIAGLNRLLTGQPGLAQMSSRTRAFALRRFDPERLTTQLVRVLAGAVINADRDANAPANVAAFPGTRAKEYL